jgi:hypothetical protein
MKVELIKRDKNQPRPYLRKAMFNSAHDNLSDRHFSTALEPGV